MRPDSRFAAVLICFFLSGLAALLYQTAWIREFSFVFGTSAIAIAAVLAAYMSGLAVGAAAAGRFLTRVRRPVLVYGVLEAAIAASALAVPLLLRGATAACHELLGGHPELPAEGGTAVLAFFFVSSFLILMVPTAFMGATLPLLIRAAVHTDAQVGPRTGVLYGINTAGAVCGTVLAAFTLLPAIGLRATVHVGVGVNFVVFLIAAVIARKPARNQPPKDIDAVASVPFHPTPAARVMLALVCLSGVTSFTYEVLWTRLLSHVLGGSVYAFATMLATFLTGIAVGSAIASRLAQRQADAARYFCFTQLGIALSSAATFFLLDRVPEWAHAVGASAGTAHLANATISAAVLLPSTLFIGATFPLAVRFVTSDGREAGAASAATYAWNTGGAILGALLAAFVLIPVLKYHGTLIAVVAANVVLAWAATRLSRGMPRSETLAVFAGGIAVIVAASLLSPPWRLLTASPVARQGAVSGTQISHYYGVGRSAVVLALQSAGGLRVYSNGLPEANVRLPGHPRAPGGGWLGTLPSLMRPDVEHMLVIGFGAGTALEQIPQTVQRIDVVELEPEVLSACRAIANVRAQDPLADPRLQLRINDARGALLLTDARYDAIVSQPSHPWTAGASHLYTRNFFEQVAEHLDDDGVFVQWMGLSWVDEELLRALLATLDAVFEHVNVLMPAPYHELYFVASNAPLEAEAAVRKLVAEVPEDARRLGILGPEDLFVELAFDEHAVRRLAAGAQVSTDDHNLLQLRSPTLLGQEAESRWGSRIFVEHDSRDRQVAGLNTAYLTRRLLDRFDAAGARRLAAIEKDPAQRALSAAWLQDGVRGGLTPQSWQRLDTLLQQFPDSESVQVAWAQSQLARYRPGQQLPTPQLQQLTPRVRALLDASTAMAIGNWPAVAQLETSLASFERFDPGFKTATRLRARWRGMASDPENSRAAVALLDSLPDLTLDDRMQRAELLLRAGEPDAALNATGAIVQQLAATLERNPQLPKSPVLPRAQAVLGRIPETPQRRNQLQATRAVMHRVMQP